MVIHTTQRTWQVAERQTCKEPAAVLLAGLSRFCPESQEGIWRSTSILGEVCCPTPGSTLVRVLIRMPK